MKLTGRTGLVILWLAWLAMFGYLKYIAPSSTGNKPQNGRASVQLFKKKYPAKGEISLGANRWAVATGAIDSHPAIVSYNADAEKLCGHPDYKHQVGIAVPLNSPDKNGFPSKEEGVELGEIEDQIVSELQAGNESLLVGRLTTDGMREFVLYTSNPEGVKSKLEKLQHDVKSHELQLMIQGDPKWSVCRKLFFSAK